MQEDIKILEDFRRVQERMNEVCKIESNIPIVQAISKAISCMKAMDEAGDVPKRREGIVAILDKEGKRYYKQEQLADGTWNELHDQFTPIVAKLKLRVKELEENSKEWEDEARTLRDTCEELREKLSQEIMKVNIINEELKQKLSDYNDKFLHQDRIIDELERDIDQNSRVTVDSIKKLIERHGMYLSPELKSFSMQDKSVLKLANAIVNYINKESNENNTKD